MTETSKPASIPTSTTRPSPSSDVDYGPRNASGVTAWAGWIVFAAVMLVILGVFQVIEGLVALFDRGYYVVRPEGLVLHVDYTAWGWLHLVLGVLAVAVGLGLMKGNTAARVGGVVLAGLSAIVNLAFIAAYPVWSTIIIAVDVIVIYAIVVHGRELQPS